MMNADGSYPHHQQVGGSTAANHQNYLVPPSAHLHHNTEYHIPSSSSSTTLVNDQAQGGSSTLSSSSALQSSPFSKHLGRNLACSACRSRKLKCDGLRPICGQCSRAWNARKRSLKAKGYDEQALNDIEKPCSYLNVRQRSERGQEVKASTKSKQGTKRKVSSSFSSIDDVERERQRLEQEVVELRARLGLQDQGEGSSLNGIAPSQPPNSDELSIAEILATTMRSGEGFPHQDATHLHSFVSHLTGLDQSTHLDSMTHSELDASKIYPHPIPQLRTQHSNKISLNPIIPEPAAVDPFVGDHISGNNQAYSEMISTGWPSDFPSPSTAELLCQVFFEQCHYLRCIFQPSRFLEQLSHGPGSPQFPSVALLHSIFAMAYSLRPDLDPANLPMSQDPSGRAGLLNTENGFISARYHCDRVKHYLSNLDGRPGIELFSLCKAAIVLTNVQFGLAHMLEAWATSGLANKLATALYLNRGRGDTRLAGEVARVDYLSTSLLRPSSNWIEEEERRRVIYYAFGTDRACAASVLWTSSCKESDLTTPLPMCSTQEYHQERIDASLNPSQTLQSPDLFSSHLDDSFVLAVKGLILVGRCGEFLSKLPPSISLEDVKQPEWHHLNSLVSTFSSTIPMESGLHQGLYDSTRILAGVCIHTCALLLHEPLMRLDENSISMCRSACTCTVNTLRYISAQNIDVTPMSSMFSFGIGVAGRVLVRLLDVACKSSPAGSFSATFPQNNLPFSRQESYTGTHNSFSFAYNYAHVAGLGGGTGSDWERTLQDEIDVIFITLCKYGRIWPVALRQAKAMARQLGVAVTSPELLRYGLFTDRNNGSHMY